MRIRPYGNRVVMLGEDGENITSIVNGLISAAGDTATAYFNAQNNARNAQTPSDQDKWEQVAAALAARQNQQQGTNYTPWIIGGAVALGAVVLLSSTGRRRR